MFSLTCQGLFYIRQLLKIQCFSHTFGPCGNLCNEKGSLIGIQGYTCTAGPCTGTLLWELGVKHSTAVDCNSVSCGQAGFSPLD